MSKSNQFPKWIIVARWESPNLQNYDLALKGFTSLYSGYPVQFIGFRDKLQTWEVLLNQSEYDQCPDYVKRLNQPTQKDSLIDQINNAIQGILDRVLLEDTLNKLELVSSLLDDLVGMDTLKEYPAIEALISDLYNALLDSDSPLNR